jgi:hypothetical protein
MTIRLIAASARGLLGGWLLALAVPLLSDAVTISEWSASGLRDQARSGLAIVEILGAALFAFEPLITIGFALLLAALAFAAALHIHFGKAPWHLLFYALISTLLLYLTKHSRRIDPAS